MKCAWLENYLVVEADGWTRPCCLENSKTARISDVNEGILTAWNHPKLLKLREDLKNGYSDSTKPFCHRCEFLENHNHQSMRQTSLFFSEKREMKLLQFKMSNKCQLTCAHCGPDQSSSWAKLKGIKPLVSRGFDLTDKFFEELDQVFPQLEYLKFTGGEPFLDLDHWKILEFLKDKDKSNCRLEYITNGITPFKPQLWEGWKKITCEVSADGYEGSYNWFRRGSDWNKLIKSVDEMSKYASIVINYAITPYTIQDYFNAKTYWENKGYPIRFYECAMPMHMRLNKFPTDVIENHKDIPFSDYVTEKDLNMYVNWARGWDQTWNTQGWAEKIFKWI